MKHKTLKQLVGKHLSSYEYEGYEELAVSPGSAMSMLRAFKKDILQAHRKQISRALEKRAAALPPKMGAELMRAAFDIWNGELP